MQLFWVLETAIFIAWVGISAFLWNNRFRLVSDTAPVLRGFVLPTILRMLEILLPLCAAAGVYSRYGIWLGLSVITVFYLAWRLISSRSYKVVFRQYRLLHVYDLTERGELHSQTEADIDAVVHKLLMMNLKK